MSAISVFQVKFNVEFTRQAVNFSILPFYLVYTGGDFSGFVKVSGFINFRVFGLVGAYTETRFTLEEIFPDS